MTISRLKRWTVIDLFSGGGGMSYGFHAHPRFQIIGAVDAQRSKPSMGNGALECNATYAANIGLVPLDADLSLLTPQELCSFFKSQGRGCNVDVLISCAPCTGFSRTIRQNLVRDDPRNSLISRSADFVEELQPSIFLMENVGELLQGRFSCHYERLRGRLEMNGYTVHAEVHSLNDFGLPQTRRRALVIAAKKPTELYTLRDLWEGHAVRKKATHVRRAIAEFPPVNAGERHPADFWHVSPNFTKRGLRRLELIPANGGSWPDLLRYPEGADLLIPSMKKYVAQGKVGPHRDVYGRMAWDSPSVTLKRECSHTGNGRYAHPEQHRLCTVREMAVIQGFPRDYRFEAQSLSNMYRHIGDAVPPLISYQLAKACEWMLSGKKPDLRSVILPNTHLQADDIIKTESVLEQIPLFGAGGI